MKPIAILRMRATSSFTPVAYTRTSGTAATETVPAGATSCVITADGAGGAGGRDLALDPGGGGGSARSVKTIAVIGGDTFTYTVPPSVAGRSSNGTGNSGAAATVTGTVFGGSVSLSAGGGAGGTRFVGGAGGTASGGDTNTSGQSALGIEDAGADSAGGGIGGSANVNGTAPGGGGGGAPSGTSGGGARGQIIFSYT